MKNFCILLCAALLIFSCSKKEDGKVLVTIDGEKITLNEFNKALDKIPMNMKNACCLGERQEDLPRQPDYKEDASQGSQEGKNRYGTRNFSKGWMRSKTSFSWNRSLKKKLTIEGKVTDEDLKKYYDAHKEEFKKEGRD